ncbi:MAG: leucyl aminopeptidase [Aestuariivita sp.]|nr:leucyl aminopeptidase [Aestuariivita sp.]MCY4345301.1 leucyl aminopeptidase [Aestuariivita sp.]
MTELTKLNFVELNMEVLSKTAGRVAVCVTASGKMDAIAKNVDRLMQGGLTRLIDSPKFAKMKIPHVETFVWPKGMTADALDILFVPNKPTALDLREAGAELVKRKGEDRLTVLWGNRRWGEELALGILLRDYSFDPHKTKDTKTRGAVSIQLSKTELAKVDLVTLEALATGVIVTRDLVNEPANHLTTDEFSHRLSALSKFGIKVEILEEKDLAELGMHMLLSVGKGSVSNSKVVVMRWQGATKKDAPMALVGKGVVFDTGGISLKRAEGMEEMTMDMGGAAVVAGVMCALAKRRAHANVVGVVGLVENMPSGEATRPGDVVTSLKGDTVEIINTDAEGRLVLGDIMWYTQERFSPVGMIDLATLTGAIIVSLGHSNAGVFSNHDQFCNAFLKASAEEGEGAWRMPLGNDYDKLLKSRVADMKNVGGRDAGAISAAQFLQRFVRDDCPWIHLDIAGVALVKAGTKFAPAGATGWGVLAINKLIHQKYERN